jgi:phosphoribosylaminoimidazolecarboxamide formyltransferase / IMP cyclohydrolase
MAMNRVQEVDRFTPVRHVIVSVSDKTGLDILVPGLLRVVPNVRIYSTGGTFQRIREILGDSWNQHLTSVSDYTGQPEMQGGLVKTLDFRIYLGLLNEPYNGDHRQDIRRVNGVSFDMVVVNLYPFVRTVSDPATTPEIARGNIDIGGPCMLRAAAKNFIRVAAVCDTADYEGIIETLAANRGRLPLDTRFTLARKAFGHTAAYDTAVAGYLGEVAQADLLREYTFHDEGE